VDLGSSRPLKRETEKVDKASFPASSKKRRRMCGLFAAVVTNFCPKLILNGVVGKSSVRVDSDEIGGVLWRASFPCRISRWSN